MLIKHKLIEIISTTKSFRNLIIIDITKDGERLASNLIDLYIKNLNFQEIFNKFNQFLLYYIQDNDLIRIDEKFRYYQGQNISLYDTIRDNKLNFLIEWSIYYYEKHMELFSYLEEKRICYKAFNFVGTRQGEIRQGVYLIPLDFIKTLKQYKNKLNISNFKRELKEIERFCYKNISVYEFFRDYNEESYDYKSYSSKVKKSIIEWINKFERKKIISLNFDYKNEQDFTSAPFKILKEDRYKNLIKELDDNYLKDGLKEIKRLFKTKKKLNGIKVKTDIVEDIKFADTNNGQKVSSNIFIGLGGVWESNKFLYKVKLQNNGKSVITDLNIILSKYPSMLELRGKSNSKTLSKLDPNGAIWTPQFELIAGEECVSGVIFTNIAYFDY